MRHEPGVLARGDEADLLAVGLVGRHESKRGGPGPYVGLRQAANREHHSSQPVWADVEQHVRLVAGRIEAAAERRAAGFLLEPGVVPGGDMRSADRVGVVKEPAELDPSVAADARVWRAAAAVVGGERIDDPLELHREIEGVERNPEPVGDPTGIEGIGRAAAALMPRPRQYDRQRVGGFGGREHRRGVPHEHADAVVSLLDEQRGGDARIDATRHRHHDAATHLSRRSRSRRGAAPAAHGRRAGQSQRETMPRRHGHRPPQ